MIDGEIVKQDCTKFGCKWDVYSKHTKCYIDPELSGYEVILIFVVEWITLFQMMLTMQSV